MSKAARWSTLSYAAYGLLGLPLAMAALPVYVQIPAYYSTQLGLALAATGWILFLARFVDAVQDPLLGYLIDRWKGKLTGWFCAAGVLLAAAFAGLWLPPVRGSGLGAWLALMLIAAYSAHSMLNIAYLSWGARFNDSKSPALLGAAAWREGLGLVGVILASVIPSMIFAGSRQSAHLVWYSLGFALILALALGALLLGAPAWQRQAQSAQLTPKQQWQVLIGNQAFRALLLPYFINAVAVSVPATLVLFFINDRLQASAATAGFLSTYFVAAALGLPLWVQLAKRFGVVRSWQAAMLLAIAAFISASLLGPGQSHEFLLICLLSGLALGADLALPPVLLAQVIGADVPPAAYYGCWTLLGKLALALSGLALPVLAQLGYHPGTQAGSELAWIYAGVPCGLKCIAFFLLMRIAAAHPVHRIN